MNMSPSRQFNYCISSAYNIIYIDNDIMYIFFFTATLSRTWRASRNYCWTNNIIILQYFFLEIRQQRTTVVWEKKNERKREITSFENIQCFNSDGSIVFDFHNVVCFLHCFEKCSRYFFNWPMGINMI